MTEYRDYPYSSVLAPFIQDYVAEKRALGYIYNVKGYQLFRLDQYWNENGYKDAAFTPERLDAWMCSLPGESKSSQNSRIGAARGIARYLNTHGIKCYIPTLYVGKDQKQIHVMDKTELAEFFSAVDSYQPKTHKPCDLRMANEYPIIFRLFYCCGMRNNEVCELRKTDIDLENGIVTIYDGKKHRDRLVYLPEDLLTLIRKYCRYLEKDLGVKSEWLFPGRFLKEHVLKTSIDRNFRDFWNKTEASKHCDKRPTPHSLRHGFVVDRINNWILAGIDINVMFVYLSKYLGHKDPDESFYYYHLVREAYDIIKQRDTVTKDVIPEVRRR